MENKTKAKSFKQVTTLVATAILVMSIYSLVQMQYMTVPAFAAGSLSASITPASDKTGADTKYTFTGTVATRNFIKYLVVTFPHSPTPSFTTNGGSVSSASLGGVEGLREDGSLSCTNGPPASCTYTSPRPVRLNPDRIVTLVVDGINNPDVATSYSITFATKDKDGNTIDSSSKSVSFTANLASIGEGALSVSNTEGDVTISASNTANTADVIITAEDKVTIDADDIEIDAAGELDLASDADSISLDANDDDAPSDSEIFVTDDVVTINAALTTESLKIKGLIPTLTFEDTDDLDLEMIMNGGTLTFDIDAGSDELTLSSVGLLTLSGGLHLDGDIKDTSGNLVLNDAVDIGSATTGINISTTGIISDIDGSLVLDDQTDIGSTATGIRVTTAGAISDIDGNVVIGDTVDLGDGANGARIATDGSISDINGDLVLDDQTLIGSSANGIQVTTAGAISDTNAEVSINDSFKLGTDGSVLTDITVGRVEDGSSGWIPDGAASTFTVTASAASITNDAVILASFDGGVVLGGGGCIVVGVVPNVSFTLTCGVVPVNGAALNYMIVDP